MKSQKIVVTSSGSFTSPRTPHLATDKIHVVSVHLRGAYLFFMRTCFCLFFTNSLLRASPISDIPRWCIQMNALYVIPVIHTFIPRVFSFNCFFVSLVNGWNERTGTAQSTKTSVVVRRVFIRHEKETGARLRAARQNMYFPPNLRHPPLVAGRRLTRR